MESCRVLGAIDRMLVVLLNRSDPHVNMSVPFFPLKASVHDWRIKNFRSHRWCTRHRRHNNFTAFSSGLGRTSISKEGHISLNLGTCRVGKDWEYIRWWEYGEKEEVMNPPGGRLDGRWEDGGEKEGTNEVRSRGRRMTGLCKTGEWPRYLLVAKAH